MVSTQFKFDRTNGYITFSEISLLIMCLHVAAVSKFYKILYDFFFSVSEFIYSWTGN